SRYFAAPPKENISVSFAGQKTLLGTKQVFTCPFIPALSVAVEICHDLWAGASPCFEHVLAGANLIVNLACTDEVVGKNEERKTLVKAQSQKATCAYLLSCAKEGESTTDGAFGGAHLYAECGKLIAENEPFAESNTLIVTADLLTAQTLRLKNPPQAEKPQGYAYPSFLLQPCETQIKNLPAKTPFIPESESECDLAFHIQAYGLAKRMRAAYAKSLIFGISGGLDSTLAALVCVKAAELAGMDKSQIFAVTMPCFGTTERTESNAEKLAKSLGISFETISIKEAVSVHLKDISHPENTFNAAYENAQARERTQVLMDLANDRGGLVVGTGDLSELALGWATYNGDHMSMYGVNASVPKTLIRYMLSLFASRAKETNPALAEVLFDIVDTPISPELLPAQDGKISQCTEDIVGPYILHDYFIWHLLHLSQSPAKVLRLACATFTEYTKEFIAKTLETFIRRFFSQQFKRSCLPDGPKVTAVSLSPRAGFKMPSDACATLWLADLKEE
ncbi:MAG: NAD(+) synthase, partial [Clostridia bacterium]|nr:NAD(+) synthase [Clostridia bacterium]